MNWYERMVGNLEAIIFERPFSFSILMFAAGFLVGKFL